MTERARAGQRTFRGRAPRSRLERVRCAKCAAVVGGRVPKGGNGTLLLPVWHKFDGEPCDHGCKHSNIAVIGWGPTTATYELEECRDCWCRAWRDGRWTQERQRHTGMEPFWWTQMDWRQVGVSRDDVSREFEDHADRRLGPLSAGGRGVAPSAPATGGDA